MTTGCGEEPTPPSTGVFLHNPGNEFIPLNAYALSEQNLDETGMNQHKMPALRHGGKITFYGIPLDYSKIYLGTNFELLYHGIRSPDSPLPCKKINDSIYSWDWETLEGKLCSGVFYILEPNTYNVWFFYYDDMSGVSEMLGDWGQLEDYITAGYGASTPVISIYMIDCRLYVSPCSFGKYPASFENGQIRFFALNESYSDSTEVTLVLDESAEVLVAPKGLPLVKEGEMRFGRYIKSGPSDVTKAAQADFERQLKELKDKK
jgi:hypothetical protein